jgi:hypothetical protein
LGATGYRIALSLAGRFALSFGRRGDAIADEPARTSDLLVAEPPEHGATVPSAV